MSIFFQRRHVALLFLLAAMYLMFYLAHPALPGNSATYPLGWWGWFDQGEYLKAAKAISESNFESSNYFYPPLYSLLGAAFIGINPMHAYAVLNMALFLLYAHYFVSMAERYVGWWWAVFILLLTFISPKNTILDVWVEPWTSTLVSAIFAFLFFDVDRHSKCDSKISNPRLMLWGILGGAVFLTRPADAVVISPLFTYVVLQIWRQAPQSQKYHKSIGFRFQNTALLIFSGLSVSVLFVVFNFSIHDSLGGRYFAMAETNGFHFADIFEKLVSLFLDAGAIYNSENDAIFSRLKWLALSVPAAIYGLVKGGATIRVIIACISVQLLIYAPFADLLPTGVWLFHNIHYFKWFIPYSGFLIFLWLRELFRKSPALRQKYAWWFSLVVGSIFLSLNLRLKEINSNEFQVGVFSEGQKKVLRINSVSGAHLIDKISFPTLTGGFDSVYFSGGARVKADGSGLNYVRDFRFLPAPCGSDLVFIRPLTVEMIEIDPGSMTLGSEPVQIRFYRYRFSIGKPKWIR
jgi:hypothetical protein